MKMIEKQSLAVGLAVAGVLAFGTLAFADSDEGYMRPPDSKMQEDVKNHIDTMHEASTALMSSNPTLAQQLSSLADVKKDRMENRGSYRDKGMAERTTEAFKNEMNAHITTMRNAADELKTSNPELSMKLYGMADMKANMMVVKEKKETEGVRIPDAMKPVNR